MNFYPFDHPGLTLVKDNKAVLEYRGHYCGYVALKKESIPEEWWGCYSADALAYLNIHEGLTYCCIKGDYVVFGFDCAHANDEYNPDLKNPEYVMRLTEQMEQQLIAYRERIEEYRSSSRERKIEIMDEIRKIADTQEQLGICALLDICFGGQTIFEETLEH